MIDPAPEGRDLVGKTVAGRYEVARLLGRGGMGAVYEAVQQPLSRKVALKVIRRALSEEPMAVKRFTQEAQAVAQLAHPNIVVVHDFGQAEDGLLFLAMELLEGQSVQRVLDERGPIAWERTLDVVIEVCRALSFAHKKGVIHRDLKPDNVMLIPIDGEDRVKVVDFGVAKLLEADVARSALTGTGMVVGTPGYISPEQVNGVSDDPRSDLYALGVLWFEMLTGRPPFEGETPMKVVLRHLHDPAPRPSSLQASSLPREIDALVQRLMGKEPAARARSAAALLEELSELRGRRGELLDEVKTASLSVAELAEVRSLAAAPGAPDAPSRAPLPASAPSSKGPTTPATGGGVAIQSAPPKKRKTSPLLLGCLIIPGALFLLGGACLVALISRGPPSPPGVLNAPSGFSVNGVPLDEAALKKAAGKRLGGMIEDAIAGKRRDAGVADLAIEGALEVVMEGIAEIPDADDQRRALKEVATKLDAELKDADLDPARRRILQRIKQRAESRRAELEASERGKQRVNTGASEAP